MLKNNKEMQYFKLTTKKNKWLNDMGTMDI